jgi:4-hydroxybenzoate polyprenyltransferase
LKKDHFLKRVFDFFVFSSLFIACCAVLMVYQTVLLFNVPLSFDVVGFVFFGTVCSYNFHWYLTPPNVGGPTEKVIWNIKNKHIHLGLFFIGLIGAAVFSFLLLKHWFWLGITAFVTFLYSAPKIPHPLFWHLRKIAVGKTIFLAFSWAHVTALLPLVLNHTNLSEAEIWFVVNRFFFIYAICILFDYRDRESDKKDKIRSLITFLSERGIDIIFWGSMLIFFISLWLLAQYISIFMVVALGIPGLLLCFLYYPSKNNSSDYLYYFVLDGLMMLSAPIVVLAKFAR